MSVQAHSNKFIPLARLWNGVAMRPSFLVMFQLFEGPPRT